MSPLAPPRLGAGAALADGRSGTILVARPEPGAAAFVERACRRLAARGIVPEAVIVNRTHVWPPSGCPGPTPEPVDVGRGYIDCDAHRPPPTCRDPEPPVAPAREWQNRLGAGLFRIPPVLDIIKLRQHYSQNNSHYRHGN